MVTHFWLCQTYLWNHTLAFAVLKHCEESRHKGHTKLAHFLGKRSRIGVSPPLAPCLPCTQAKTNKAAHINSAVANAHESETIIDNGWRLCIDICRALFASCWVLIGLACLQIASITLPSITFRLEEKAVELPWRSAKTQSHFRGLAQFASKNKPQRSKLKCGPPRSQEEILPIVFVLEALNPQTIDSGNLQVHFEKYFDQAQAQTEGDKITSGKMSRSSMRLITSLNALSLAADIYKLLPGATVAISILSTSMYKASFCSGAGSLVGRMNRVRL
jgi:hypothetical protein